MSLVRYYAQLTQTKKVGILRLLQLHCTFSQGCSLASESSCVINFKLAKELCFGDTAVQYAHAASDTIKQCFCVTFCYYSCILQLSVSRSNWGQNILRTCSTCASQFTCKRKKLDKNL